MLTFRKLSDKLVGTYNGRPFNTENTEDAITFLTSVRAGEVTPTMEEFTDTIKSFHLGAAARECKFLFYNKLTGEYLLSTDGKTPTKFVVPKLIARIIEDKYEDGEDFLPYIKALARMYANPRVTESKISYLMSYLTSTFTDYDAADKLVEEEGITKEAAIELCSYPDISITQEGLLATYKVCSLVDKVWAMEPDPENKGEFIKVYKNKYEKTPDVLDEVTGEVLEKGGSKLPDFAEDLVFTPYIHKQGDRFYSNGVLGYKYKVGEVQRLPLKAARNLDNTFGGGGLYSGGLRYIEHYGGDDAETLVCLVNPSHILGFQCEGAAFRTDEIMPIAVWDSKYALKGSYHSSDYAKLSESSLADLIVEAEEANIDLATNEEKKS